MSAFWLGIEPDEATTRNLDEAFEQRGFAQPTVLHAGRTRVHLFPNLQRRHVQVIQKGDSFLAAAGTCILPGHTRMASLERLLEQLIQGRRDQLDDRIGSHCLIYGNPQGVELFPDPGCLFPVFQRRNKGLMSSSVLALAAAGESELDPVALQQLLTLGFLLRPATLLKDVRVVQNPEYNDWDMDEIRVLRPELPPLPDPLRSRNRSEHASMQLKTLRQHMVDILPACMDDGVDMGISGGFDSRLLLLLCREADIPVTLHTLVKSTKDIDFMTARQVASAAGMPLNEISMSADDLPSEASIVAQNLAYYDGRPARMMSLFKYDYNPDYRGSLLQDRHLSLSGVGGEIYRNHFHTQPLGSDRLADWIGYNFVDFMTLSCITDDAARRTLLRQLEEQVAARMAMPGLRRVDLATVKRIYGELWLPDWHGTRNSVENQLTGYHSPFAEASVYRNSLQSVNVLGVDGELEAEMIRQLDPDIAQIPSSYGHGLDRIPLSIKLRSGLRAWMPNGIKLAIGRASYSNRKPQAPALTQLEANCLARVKQECTWMDLDRMVALSAERRTLVLSIGAVLNRLFPAQLP